MKKAMFLGYDQEKTRLISLLRDRHIVVDCTDQPVGDLSAYDFVVSFGYRFILPMNVISTSKRPIINLHISYLPWNRGAHPLFWAAYDGTPIGVSIHEIDAGIDTGPICYQREVNIDLQTETFSSGYAKLIDEIERLFECNADNIISQNYKCTPQSGSGSFRRARDIPKNFSWNEVIEPTITRIRRHNYKMELATALDRMENS